MWPTPSCRVSFMYLQIWLILKIVPQFDKVRSIFMLFMCRVWRVLSLNWRKLVKGRKWGGTLNEARQLQFTHSHSHFNSFALHGENAICLEFQTLLKLTFLRNGQWECCSHRYRYRHHHRHLCFALTLSTETARNRSLHTNTRTHTTRRGSAHLLFNTYIMSSYYLYKNVLTSLPSPRSLLHTMH